MDFTAVVWRAILLQHSDSLDMQQTSALQWRFRAVFFETAPLQDAARAVGGLREAAHGPDIGAEWSYGMWEHMLQAAGSLEQRTESWAVWTPPATTPPWPRRTRPRQALQHMHLRSGHMEQHMLQRSGWDAAGSLL